MSQQVINCYYKSTKSVDKLNSKVINCDFFPREDGCCIILCKKRTTLLSSSFFFGCSNNLSSRTVASQVFSAQVSLTSVFGMRTGGTSPLTSPQWYIYKVALEHIVFSCISSIHFFSSLVNFFTR